MFELFDKFHQLQNHFETNESHILSENIIEDLNQYLTFNSTNEKYLDNNIKYAVDSLF